ncbi:UNVERIFIED_CONTAM: hypothetical protein FKN15_038547, partial [Acipenser sinensis]
QFGRTEVIDNTLNPDFIRKYILDYFFEEKQNLRFDFYDVDSKSPDLSKHVRLSRADFLHFGGDRGLTSKPSGEALGVSSCLDLPTRQFQDHWNYNNAIKGFEDC